MLEDEIRSAALDLVSDDSEQRKQGFLAIKKMGGRAAETLLQTAHNWSEQQKNTWLGIYAGGSPTEFLVHAISDENAIDALIKALHDPDPCFRGFAAFAISEIKDPRVPDLLAEAFADVDPLVRSNSIIGLQSISDECSYQLIVSAMSDENDKVRSQAAYSLGRIGGPESAEILIQALADTSERVAKSAAGSLGRLYIESAVEPLLDATHGDRKRLAEAAIRALGEIGGSKAVEGLLEILQASSSNELRVAAASVVAKLDANHTAEVMMLMLKNSDIQLRKLAVNTLIELHDCRAADSLAEALDDPNIRVPAALALAEIGDSCAIEPLTETLNIEPDMQKVRISINPKQYIEEDMNHFIRNKAAKALAKLGDDRGLHHLLMLMKSSEKNDVCYAIHALGESKNLKALTALLDILDSTANRTDRASIISAIAEIGSEVASDALMSIIEKGGESAIDAAAGLAKMGRDEGFAFLQSEIESGDNKRRTRALSKLMYIPSPKSVELIIPDLPNRPQEGKRIMFYALGNIGDRSTIKYLEPLLNDEDRQTRISAYRAIKRIERKYPPI